MSEITREDQMEWKALERVRDAGPYMLAALKLAEAAISNLEAYKVQIEYAPAMELSRAFKSIQRAIAVAEGGV